MIGLDGFIFLIIACASAAMAPVGNDRLARLKPLWAAGILLCMAAAGLSIMVRATVHLRPPLAWALLALEIAAFAATNRYWLVYRWEKRS